MAAERVDPMPLEAAAHGLTDEEKAAAYLRLVRHLNQIINFIDCSKDLNDSGKEAWLENDDRYMIESGLVVMIDELFSNPANKTAMTEVEKAARLEAVKGAAVRGAAVRGAAVRAPAARASAASRKVLTDQRDGAKLAIDTIFNACTSNPQRYVAGRNNYKIIGDDKPKMNTIISTDQTIRPYLEEPNNRVEIVRLKHSTGAGGGLSGFFVCQDNGPSDVIVDPIYLLTGGSLLDPASRTTSGENVRYLFPGWGGLKMEDGRMPPRLLNRADKLPGKYIEMLNMEGCIQTRDGRNEINNSIEITQNDGAASSAAAAAAPTGWKATIKMIGGVFLTGDFDNKMQALSDEFKGNPKKNKALADMILRMMPDFIQKGKRYLLAKELGDTLQVLWLKYICDLEAEAKRAEEAAGEASAGMDGGQRGGAFKEEKYDYANTCVSTTDIPLKCRAIVNGVGVVHTGKDGTIYHKPRGALTDEQENYVNEVLKEKLRDEMANHNESVMNAIKDVIILKRADNGNWVGGVTWSAGKVQAARNYLQTILNDLKKANDDFMGVLNIIAKRVDVSVKDVKDYTSTRYFVSPFVMKKDGYHSLRCTQPIYYGWTGVAREGPQHDGHDYVGTINISPILPNNNYERLLQEYQAYQAEQRAASAAASAAALAAASGAAPGAAASVVMEGESDGGSMKGGNHIFDEFIMQSWRYANNTYTKNILEQTYTAYSLNRHDPSGTIIARHQSPMYDDAAAAADADAAASTAAHAAHQERRPNARAADADDRDADARDAAARDAAARDAAARAAAAADIKAAAARDDAAAAAFGAPAAAAAFRAPAAAAAFRAPAAAFGAPAAAFRAPADMREYQITNANAAIITSRADDALAYMIGGIDIRDQEDPIITLNTTVDRLYGIFNKANPQLRDETRIPWAILGKDETDPLFTRQMNQYLRKTMISNTNDTFSENEQRAIDYNDSCYRVLFRNIFKNRNREDLLPRVLPQPHMIRRSMASARPEQASALSSAFGQVVSHQAAASAAASALEPDMSDVGQGVHQPLVSETEPDMSDVGQGVPHQVSASASASEPDISEAEDEDEYTYEEIDIQRIDYFQAQMVARMKANQPNFNIGIVDDVSHEANIIKAPFKNIFIFYYVSIYYPEIFTFGTMMSIGLLNFENFEQHAKDMFYDNMAHFSDDGMFHYNNEYMKSLPRFKHQGIYNTAMHTDYKRHCISITKKCIKYTRYFIEKYPQVATQSLKLFINLFTRLPLSVIIAPIGETQPQLRAINVATIGGGDKIDLLPLATDIAMNMYELHYSLRIKAAYSDRKMEDLYEERGMQIDFYNEAIQKMEAGEVEPDPYRLALLEYERHILCKQFVELPKFKEEYLKIQQTLVKTEQIPVKTQQSRKSNQPQKSKQSRKSNQLYPISVEGSHEGRHEVRHGGRFKKTRKNRKMKKLKQSYKKTKAALRKSRKH